MPVKTKSDLERFHDRFIEILETKEPTRTSRLKNLMSDLEKAYHIPMLRNEMFEVGNVRVMHLYQCVSKARDL